MRCSSRIVWGVVAATVLAMQPALAGELGEAVIQRLGRVEPTPVPSPEPEQKLRLVSSLTLQNKPDGNSQISFEVADFGEKKNGQFRVIAIAQYSLIEPKPEALELRDKIVTKIRELEQDLLDYIEIVGPPKPPQRVFELGR